MSINADTLADAISATFDAIIFNRQVKVYKWPRGLDGLDKTPCVVIYPPSIRRSSVLEAEAQLGSYDWMYVFDVEVKFEMTANTPTVMAEALTYVEAAIKAIDNSTDLKLLCEDEPKVTAAEPDYSVNEQGTRTFFHYLLEVSCPTYIAY